MNQETSNGEAGGGLGAASGSHFGAEPDDVWWGRIAREAASEELDRPDRWNVVYDDGADGCMPSGWYAQGLDSTGLPIDWPIRHEYGPFTSESEARTHAASVDASYAKAKLRHSAPVEDSNNTKNV